MGIEKAVETATARSQRNSSFEAQLSANREFSARMEKAGVVPKRQGFTIPLMERIVSPA